MNDIATIRKLTENIQNDGLSLLLAPDRSGTCIVASVASLYPHIVKLFTRRAFYLDISPA